MTTVALPRTTGAPDGGSVPEQVLARASGRPRRVTVGAGPGPTATRTPGRREADPMPEPAGTVQRSDGSSRGTSPTPTDAVGPDGIAPVASVRPDVPEAVAPDPVAPDTARPGGVAPGGTAPEPVAPGGPPPEGLAPESLAVWKDEAPARPRLRLVPTLTALPRQPTLTGPGHTRPPTVDERVLARRRAALAAERAGREQQPTTAPPTTEPTSVCCSLALAAVEALAGTRPVAQLARWVVPEVYEAIATRAALTTRVLGRRTGTRRPEVRRVRVCRIGEHIAEGAVIVDDGTRVRAVAVRLEVRRGTWRAVALDIG